MLSKRTMVKRNKEEKEKIILDCQRIGVVAGCRKHGIYSTSYYGWLEKYEAHGIDGLEDQRGKSQDIKIKKLEKENKLLKEIIAEKELEGKMKDKLLKKKFAQWNRKKK
jgi:putative transposase